jgi:hypothetical protein
MYPQSRAPHVVRHADENNGVVNTGSAVLHELLVTLKEGQTYASRSSTSNMSALTAPLLDASFQAAWITKSKISWWFKSGRLACCSSIAATSVMDAVTEVLLMIEPHETASEFMVTNTCRSNKAATTESEYDAINALATSGCDNKVQSPLAQYDERKASFSYG